MTHKFEGRGSDKQLYFNCDQPGCVKNFQCEPGMFKDGWKDAEAHGWVYVPDYEDGISRPRHFCREHAGQFKEVSSGAGADDFEALIRKRSEERTEKNASKRTKRR